MPSEARRQNGERLTGRKRYLVLPCELLVSVSPWLPLPDEEPLPGVLPLDDVVEPLPVIPDEPVPLPLVAVLWPDVPL
jgi:hypothetical protein